MLCESQISTDTLFNITPSTEVSMEKNQVEMNVQSHKLPNENCFSVVFICSSDYFGLLFHVSVCVV